VTQLIDQRRRARADVRRALILAGMAHGEADRWCALWEREAARHGLAESPYCWDAGRGWIDAQVAENKTVSPAGWLAGHRHISLDGPTGAVSPVRRRT
jgi:hypothetical protein